MDIGDELRRARKARSRSIEEISAATKISPPVLRAIENNAFDSVPGGLFTRGFLRAYAREVGLNGEAIVQQYRAEFEAAELPAGDGPDSASPGDTDLDVDMADELGRSSRTQVIEVVVIVLVVLVYFGSMRQPRPSANADLRSADAILAASAALPVAATPADVPVATTGTMDAAGGDLNVEIRPQGPCWVEATADGQQIAARLMNAGERQAVSVRQDLTLRVGDPAAFAFSINGVPGRSLGGVGLVTRVQINQRNYQTFLEPRR